MTKTATGLVEYAKKAHSEKWGYVWGTFGQLLTKALLTQKIKQYPEEVGRHNTFIEKTWLNRMVSDCVGLIKSYCWFDGTTVKYAAKTDVNANRMYELAKKKGHINTIPEVPGICVYKKGHIGVYIGGGFVIEANSTRRGVIKTPLNGRGATPWTHWLECPFIEYPTSEPAKPKPTPKPMEIKRGSTGETVKHLQMRLTQLGYPLAADGSFGPATEAAVMKFQKANKIKVDGIIGPETQKVLDRGL